jgi:flagellar FliL protein
LSKKLVIIVGAAMLLLLGGMAVVTMKATSSAKHAAAPVVKEIPKSMIALDEFVVNLADQREAHYLKVEMVLEVKGETAKKELAELKPKIRDAVIGVLSRKQYAEMLEPSGKESTKTELMAVLNKELDEAKVEGVFFNSFAMQ